jgi:hypothetical protein
LKFTVTAGEGLPIGSYAAKFSSVEPFDNGSSEYGPGVKLTFEVLQGEHQGQKASRICSVKLSPKSNLYKFLQAFKGGKLEFGEQIDLNSFVGQQGMMIVEATEGGATRVGSFIRMS